MEEQSGGTPDYQLGWAVLAGFQLDFQLGWACDLFHFSSKLKIGQKRAETHFDNKLVLKMTKFCI